MEESREGAGRARARAHASHAPITIRWWASAVGAVPADDRREAVTAVLRAVYL